MDKELGGCLHTRHWTPFRFGFWQPVGYPALTARNPAKSEFAGRFGAAENGYEMPMPLLWVLVLLLIIFALVGGFAVSNWLFVILVIALILLLVGYV